MKKYITLVLLIIFYVWYLNIENQETIVKTKINSEKNIVLWSFEKSKDILLNDIYKNSQITFYSNCNYNDDKTINFTTCNFETSWKYSNRTNKIEWEHIVPAHAFWQSFIEWRDWDEKCINSKWELYKGRECARKNEEFNYMESDIYNLVPSIWEINALRSKYSMSEIPWEEENRIFWVNLDIEIKDSKFEPRNEIKWDIARIYMYMESAYSWHWIISNKNEKLFDAWDNLDPVDEQECSLYFLKKEIQKNINIILEEKCLNLTYN